MVSVRVLGVEQARYPQYTDRRNPALQLSAIFGMEGRRACCERKP
jgi:hypothetical protein